MKLDPQSSISEQAAINWMDGIVSNLGGLLRKHGVSDANARRELLEEFFFDLCVDLDGSSEHGVEVDGAEYRPKLTFLDESTKPPTLHYSSAYDLHDYVFEFVDAAADKRES